MMQYKFIVVEGPDGVGKTTISKRLASHLDYEHIITPPEFYRNIRAHFDVPDFDPVTRFLFYATGLSENAQEIRDFLVDGQGVVADRYTDSLVIFHEIMSGKVLSHTLDIIDFPEPDITIILTANYDVFRSRIANRKKSTTDKHLEDDKDFMESVRLGFLNLPTSDKLHSIDTTELNEEGVFKKCLDILEM